MVVAGYIIIAFFASSLFFNSNLAIQQSSNNLLVINGITDNNKLLLLYTYCSNMNNIHGLIMYKSQIENENKRRVNNKNVTSKSVINRGTDK